MKNKNKNAVQSHSFYILGDRNTVYCNTCKSVKPGTGIHNSLKWSTLKNYGGVME